MMVMLKVKKLDMDAGKLYIVVLNHETMKKNALHPLDRIDVIKGKRRLTCIVNVGNKIVGEDEIGTYEDVSDELKLRDGDEVKIEPQLQPRSIGFIKKKIRGESLSYEEIEEIIKDAIDRNLTHEELASFVTGLEINGMSLDEAE